jgi:hypothetical protein
MMSQVRREVKMATMQGRRRVVRKRHLNGKPAPMTQGRTDAKKTTKKVKMEMQR